MATIINTVSDTKFSLNGTTYGKIYQPLAQGTEHLSIVNVYDTSQKLLNSTHYSEFTVNGSSYLSQDTLISALILVIFSIAEVGGSGGGSWGEITGTLSDQGDLQSALDGKASTSHSHTFTSITSKPTTLSGYGITNAYTKTESDGRYLQNETYDTPNELLTAIKTVDGTGSGLDADLLGGIANANYARTDIDETFDGQIDVNNIRFSPSSSFANANDFSTFMTGDQSLVAISHTTGSTNYPTEFGHALIVRGTTDNRSFSLWKANGDNSIFYVGNYNESLSDWQWNKLWHEGSDGTGSGLDADLLDGFNSSTSGTANTVAIRNASGQLYATAFYESSDKSLKENIEYLTPDFVKFNFKESPDQLRYGVIAQEIEKSYPELVNTNAEGLKSVNYIDLLVLKVAELQKEINQLKNG
ncbi:tail fiber domain-containing protein [Allomuricauda sp. M10]|uniref:tail fiber domain-containing protein n=1 Tax=Allomuricauda sp. M10 TaxID=2683292 RepID=UPI001D181764|nr:tail fiber domain-containing protein [Muricauda sp. M10]